MKRVLLLMTGLLLILTASITTAQENEAEPPYIMHFQPESADAGWIIEQADGRDSRVFGGDVVLPFTNANSTRARAQTAHWSPDGAWFAWIVRPEDFMNDTDAWQLAVLSVDGTIARLPFADMADVRPLRLAWFPDSNSRLLIHLQNPMETGSQPTGYMVYDPVADVIEWREDFDTTGQSSAIAYISGEQVVISEVDAGSDPNIRYVADGETQYVFGFGPAIQRISPDGRTLFDSHEGRHLLLDIETGQEIIRVEPGVLPVTSPIWNAESTAVSFYDRQAGTWHIFSADGLRTLDIDTGNGFAIWSQNSQYLLGSVDISA